MKFSKLSGCLAAWFPFSLVMSPLLSIRFCMHVGENIKQWKDMRVQLVWCSLCSALQFHPCGSSGGGGGWFVSCVGPFSCLGKARSVCAGMCGVGGSCWNLMEELQPREPFNYVHFWTVTRSSAAPCRELLVLQWEVWGFEKGGDGVWPSGRLNGG